MKKIVFMSFLGLSALGFTAVVAQQQKQDNKGQRITRAEGKENAESRAKRTTERLTKDLDLTADQQKEVYNLALENFKQDISTEEIQRSMNMRLDAILNETQREKKSTLEAKRKQQLQQSMDSRDDKKTIHSAPRNERL